MWAIMRRPPRLAAVATANRTSGPPRPCPARSGEDGEPIALPEPVARRAGRGGRRRRRPRRGSPSTLIVAGSSSWASRSERRNRRLLVDEHLFADAVVLGSRPGVVDEPADDPRRGAAGQPRAGVGLRPIWSPSCDRSHRRAGLAARAARLRRLGPEAALGQVRRHPAHDALDVVVRRRRPLPHQAAGHRPQRHDERVDADVDGPPAALDRQLRVLAHAEDHVGGDLPLAEARHRALPRAEVGRRCRCGPWPGRPAPSTSGSKDSTWMPTVSMPRSATRSITSRSSGGSNCVSTGSPLASFTAAAALGDVQRAAVGGAGAAGGRASRRPRRRGRGRRRPPRPAGPGSSSPSCARPASDTPMPQNAHWSPLPQ